MASSAGRPGEMIQGINVTPLVDVVLVLLVVLMVSASYTVSRAVPLELPQAATGETKSSPLSISIDEQGRLFLDARSTTLDELRRHLASSTQLPPSALIAADGHSEYKSVVQVIDVLRQHGVHQFAMNVSPEDLQP